MFNWLRMNLCRRMTLFSVIFGDDSLLHKYRKQTASFEISSLQAISSQTRIDLCIFICHWLPRETHMAALDLKCKPLPKCPYQKRIGHRGIRAPSCCHLVRKLRNEHMVKLKHLPT
jgi:hypothetical protein